MKIGLLDAMGSGNLGDAAIQDSVIAHLRSRLPQAQLVAFSFAPEDTTQRHGIPCYPISRTSADGHAAGEPGQNPGKPSMLRQALKRIPGLSILARKCRGFLRETAFWVRTYRTLRGLDVLVMSGGGQLGDLWGGPWGHPCNLFKFSLLTRLAGKRLYFLNVGAEPLEHRLSRFFAKSALRLAHYVSFRDQESQAQMRGMGLTATTYVRPDPAYGLDVRAYGAGTPRPAGAAVVGINPMGFYDPRVWPLKDSARYEAYLDKLVKFAAWLLDQGYAVKIFPTSAGVDRYAIVDLNAKLNASRGIAVASAGKAGASAGMVTMVNTQSVASLLAEMADCDFIVTSKYHGVIFSHLLKKPVVAPGYQRKVDVAMRGPGLQGVCATIEDFSGEWLIEAFGSVARDRAEIQARQASFVAACAGLLAGQFDELFLPSSPAPALAGERDVSRKADGTSQLESV